MSEDREHRYLLSFRHSTGIYFIFYYYDYKSAFADFQNWKKVPHLREIYLSKRTKVK